MAPASPRDLSRPGCRDAGSPTAPWTRGAPMLLLRALRLLGLATALVTGATPAGAQGSLTLYTSESLDKVNEMKADFERRQPGIAVNVYRSGTQVVIGKLQAEIQAAAIQADLVWMADIEFFAQLAPKGLLVP